MPDIRAVKNGVWSDATVWTPNPPAAGDVVRPNNFIVTMDVNATVAEIRNDAGGGAVVGGRFIINSGVSVTATTITVGQAGVRLITHSGVGAASITGTITNTNLNAQYLAIENASSGILNINGNILFPQNNTTILTDGFIQNTINGTINITGIVNGNVAGANRAQCVVNVSTGTINIVGNVNSPAAGALFFTIVNVSTGTITIQGNVTTTAATAIDNRSSGIITITGTCNSSATGVLLTNSSGTVTINGNVAHTQTTQALTTIIDNTGAGTITITGDVSGAVTVNVNAASGSLIRNNSSGVISIIGQLSLVAWATTTGNSSNTLLNNSTGTINVTGSVIGQNHTGTGNASGILNNSTGTVNITGNIQAGATVTTGTSFAVRNIGLGVVNVIGNASGNGGTGRNLVSIGNDGGGTVNIAGNAIGGSTGNAVLNSSTGTINLNGNAIGGTSFFAIEGVSSAGNTIIERAVYSNLGQSPITGYIKFKTTNPEIDVLRTDNVIVTLRDSLNVSGLLPATNNVRSGTTYNTGSSTGTLAMPAANLVQLGVPVGATFGTANLTPADFWNYLTSGITQSGSIGERLKVSSTVDTTLAQIASFS
jgi:hypothetical protein